MNTVDENRVAKKKQSGKIRGKGQIDWMITLLPLGLIAALSILFFLLPEQSNTVLAKVRFFLGDTFGVSLIVKVVVSKNIYFLFVQVIRYCSVPDVSINKLSTFIGNHVRHRILPDHHHFE